MLCSGFKAPRRVSPDTRYDGPFASTWDRLPEPGVSRGAALLRFPPEAAPAAADTGVWVASLVGPVLLPAHVRRKPYFLPNAYGKTNPSLPHVLHASIQKGSHCISDSWSATPGLLMAAGVVPVVATTEVTPSLPGLAALGAMQLGVCRVEAAGAPFPKVPGMHPAVLCAGFLATVLLPASAIGCKFVATEGCRGPVQAKVLTPQHRHSTFTSACNNV